MSTTVKDEGGFSLIELLVVISILGVISFVLTEAFILGLKTTDGITSDVSNSVAVQALRSNFTGDVQKAQQVSTASTGTSCAPGPASSVILELSWPEPGTQRRVSYSLDGGTPGQRELVRRSCTNSTLATPDERILGHFEFEPTGGPPVQALCSPDAACATVTTVTMKILTNRPQNPAAPIELTVRRRLT